MSARANYFKIGLFVISAATIAILAIIVLGAGVFFREKFFLETYIKESVQGLDVGSPVRFRGVQVGNVEQITLVGREYRTGLQYVLVRASLFPDAFLVPSERIVKGALQKEIDKGLRLRLASQGLTGTAYLEADYLDPKQNPPLEIDWEPRYLYIPSAPSTITRLSESIDRILRNLEQINIQGITVGMEKSLKAVTQAIEDAHIEKISGQTETLLKEVRKTNKQIGQLLDTAKIEPALREASAVLASARRILDRSEKPVSQMLGDITKATASLRQLADRIDSLMRSKEIGRTLEMVRTASEHLPETLALLNRALKRLDNLVSNQQQDIEATIENFRVISANLKELTDNAKKYPAQILFGGPPPPTDTGKSR